MHNNSILEHAAALRRREYSSVELTQYFLERIHQHQALNAFISVTAETALAQAQSADDALARASLSSAALVNAALVNGDPSNLIGIPLAHKDLFCTQGVKTTCGSKILENFISPYNATVVEKLAAAGMVTLGKTNMDEFAMGSSNENSYFGAVKNPWAQNRVPGGSSGGSAAAVAARLTPIATATDTGGSIRQPAAFCGLSGIKPSYGRVSRFGMVAFASSLDQAGVLANRAEDAAVMLQAMCGFDAKDSTSLQVETPNYMACLGDSLAGKVIGLPAEFFNASVSPEIAASIQAALKVFESLGAKTVSVSLPNSAAGIPCYYVLAPAEASSNLSRFDGVRYGNRAEQYADLNDMYESTRAQGFGDEVKRRIMIGTYVLSSGYYDAYYIKAQKLRRMISDDFKRAFERCDFIAGATTPTTAFALGEKNHDPVAMYLNDIFTNSANLAGLPALSIPAGFDSENLPIGLHLIGRYLDEATLLNAAHQFQLNTDWHVKTPPELAAGFDSGGSQL